MNKPIENWEEEFTKKYELFELCDSTSLPDYNRLKAFIRKTLKQEIARVGEEIIGEKWEHRFECVGVQNNTVICDCGAEGYNIAKAEQRKHLQEILKAL